MSVINDFNRDCQLLENFALGKEGHERIDFDPTGQLVTHGKDNFFVRVFRWLKRCFTSEEHPSNRVATKVLEFFQANEKHLTGDHAMALYALKKIKKVTRPDMDQQYDRLTKVINEHKHSEAKAEAATIIDKARSEGAKISQEHKKYVDYVAAANRRLADAEAKYEVETKKLDAACKAREAASQAVIDTTNSALRVLEKEIENLKKTKEDLLVKIQAIKDVPVSLQCKDGVLNTRSGILADIPYFVAYLRWKPKVQGQVKSASRLEEINVKSSSSGLVVASASTGSAGAPAIRAEEADRKDISKAPSLDDNELDPILALTENQEATLDLSAFSMDVVRFFITCLVKLNENPNTLLDFENIKVDFAEFYRLVDFVLPDQKHKLPASLNSFQFITKHVAFWVDKANEQQDSPIKQLACRIIAEHYGLFIEHEAIYKLEVFTSWNIILMANRQTDPHLFDSYLAEMMKRVKERAQLVSYDHDKIRKKSLEVVENVQANPFYIAKQSSNGECEIYLQLMKNDKIYGIKSHFIEFDGKQFYVNFSKENNTHIRFSIRNVIDSKPCLLKFNLQLRGQELTYEQLLNQYVFEFSNGNIRQIQGKIDIRPDEPVMKFKILLRKD